MIKHYSNGKVTSLETSIDGKELVWSHIKPDVNVLSGPNGSGKGELLYYMRKQLDLGTSLHYDSALDIEGIRYMDREFTCTVEDFILLEGGPKQATLDLLNSRLREYCGGYEFSSNDYPVESINGDYYYPSIPKSEGIKRLITMYLWVYNIQYGEDYTDKEAFMYNPDVYLHFDLIKKLIGDFKSIAPDVQFFITTYNPALIIEGWHDRVAEITDLYIKPL